MSDFAHVVRALMHSVRTEEEAHDQTHGWFSLSTPKKPRMHRQRTAAKHSSHFPLTDIREAAPWTSEHAHICQTLKDPDLSFRLSTLLALGAW